MDIPNADTNTNFSTNTNANLTSPSNASALSDANKSSLSDANSNATDKLSWSEISKTQILQTPIFTVNETLSTSPDGKASPFIVIDAPDWCTVIPEIDDSFLMVKQFRHGTKTLSIEFPGGVVEKNEEPLFAAKRELLEETGFTTDDIIYLGTTSPNPAFMTNKMHFFLAKNLQDTKKQNLDPNEFVEYLKIPKKEVLQKMGTAEYPHALMCCALNFYRQYKNL